MKALVYTGPNSVIYRDAPTPEPKAGEALIKVEAVGICGSDMHAYHGHDSRRPPPLILGHEAAGMVMSGALKGRRVTINPLVTEPDSAFAQTGRPHLAPTRQILSMPPRAGAFAEYVCAPETNLYPIPDGMPFARAALAEPVSVSYHCVRQGERLMTMPLAQAHCVVIGGGAIGLAAALCLAMLGAGSIHIGETLASRRDALRRNPAIIAYEPGGADEPMENSVDLVIDAVGAGATRAAACRMIRPGGVIVHAGLLPGHDGLDIRKITLQEIVFSGTYCYTPTEFGEIVAALASGQLGPLDWFEARPLSDGAKAFADIDTNRVSAAKIVLIP